MRVLQDPQLEEEVVQENKVCRSLILAQGKRMTQPIAGVHVPVRIIQGITTFEIRRSGTKLPCYYTYGITQCVLRYATLQVKLELLYFAGRIRQLWW